ncbi:MAG: hypothetical protein CM15mP126_8120 [Gammaproteobacteria bacterium]|nr:MAG: hypothetical protein CM15mP126_8120 [Gammaproteobacteria bacterium]
MWESSFLDGMIPANWVFDAQLSFDAPELNGKFKVGAVNLSGKDYLMMPGSGLIESVLCTVYIKSVNISTYNVNKGVF